MRSGDPLAGHVQGFARVGLVWLLGCMAAGGGLLASASRHAHSGAVKYRTKNIEDVRVSDWVLSRDPGDNDKPSPHRVVALPRNWTQHVIHVQLASGHQVQATGNHPFYVAGRGWIPARELRAGDPLTDERGTRFPIAHVWTENRICATFNLSVEGVHTFYVLAGPTPLLVHNADPPGGDIPYPDPQRPPYNNGQVQMDHEDAVVHSGKPRNQNPPGKRPLPAETNFRRGGYDSALHKEEQRMTQKMVDQGMSRTAAEKMARDALQSEINALKNSPPPRPMDPRVLNRLPAPCN